MFHVKRRRMMDWFIGVTLVGVAIALVLFLIDFVIEARHGR